MIEPLFEHQVQSVKFLETRDRALDFSDPGCVSADTEFLTPAGWKRIDTYSVGDQVAQFLPDTREIEFVTPLCYVKRPCSTMIAIEPVRGTSQRLSHEHRVLYYNPDGSWGVCSAAQFVAELDLVGGAHLHRKFATTFRVRNNTCLPMSDEALRVMVAVIADGHFPCGTPRCTVRVKKTRKIERLQRLLADAGIEYTERSCGGQLDFRVLRFNAPYRHKEFSDFYWGASQQQLELIADEAQHWDGSISSRPSGACRFSSFIKASSEFIQYAFAASGRTASISSYSRFRRSRTETEYVVHARKTSGVGPGRRSAVKEVENLEGFKYCFEVPSTFLLLRRGGHIFATGNTGKTRVEIEDFVARRNRGGGCALVLAPKSLLRSAWADDFNKFAPTILVGVATAYSREKVFAQYADVYVTNTDQAKWLAKQPTAFFRNFDTLIVDEIPAFKHHTSQRSKALNKIKKYFKYRRGMTGTPTANGMCDLWHQVFLIDDGARLGKSFFQFRGAVCQPEQVGPLPQHLKWIDKPGAEASIYGLLKDLVVRHEFEACTDIPANHQYSLAFRLTREHTNKYKLMENDATMKLSDGHTVSAIHAASLLTKLLQVSSGAVYNDAGGYSVVDTGRTEMVLDLIEERKHSVVFFLWKHQRDQLIAEAKARGVTYCTYDGDTPDKDKKHLVDRFQQGYYRTMFAHPQSAAHGLTLTKGTSTIWCSPTYDLSHFIQGNQRIYRIGQKEKTETIVLIAPGTVEEKVWRRLQAKDAKQETLLELLTKEN